MKKIYQLLGNGVATKGDFGVEIEVEGKRLPIVENGGWKCEKDGSLRGESMEYIFAKPVAHDKVKRMIEFLNEQFAEAGSTLNFSFRTSVHVHMNMQEANYVQVLNTIYTYLLLEEPFVTFCGKERKGNRFCLRLQDAEGLLDTLGALFRGGERHILNIPRDHVRYASINIEALTKYGSLEFRAMRGNNDVATITTWTDALYRLRTFAMEQESPESIFNLYADIGPAAFMERVLGDAVKHFQYIKVVKDVQRSFSLSLDLPIAYQAFKREEAEIAARPKVVFDDGEEDVGPAKKQLDMRGNVIKVGDRVRVRAEIVDYELGWNREMSKVVQEGESFVVTRVRNNAISLGGSDYTWPSKSIWIDARKPMMEGA